MKKLENRHSKPQSLSEDSPLVKKVNTLLVLFGIGRAIIALSLIASNLLRDR
jgi:hypothetical protein